ncbi:2-polyprenyl-6-methoxyphenol hydroxylase-like FAD-dependent oxidoreductase [Undibacterium sp. GrIS 1.8]|uniref:NAD(P)-binding protein n=1 Tax=unclassified Undibacterium TaxID=2630295 RepID=UPI0033945785
MNKPLSLSKSLVDSHIIIVGAGMGGLILALVLHVNGIRVTIYEADVSPHARLQDAFLDIYDYNGMAYLQTNEGSICRHTHFTDTFDRLWRIWNLF